MAQSHRRLIDRHYGFTRLATAFPWLATVESWARAAKIQGTDDFHQALSKVHYVTSTHLPHPALTVADLHLCRLVDDSAENLLDGVYS